MSLNAVAVIQSNKNGIGFNSGWGPLVCNLGERDKGHRMIAEHVHNARAWVQVKQYNCTWSNSSLYSIYLYHCKCHYVKYAIFKLNIICSMSIDLSDVSFRYER